MSCPEEIKIIARQNEINKKWRAYAGDKALFRLVWAWMFAEGTKTMTTAKEIFRRRAKQYYEKKYSNGKIELSPALAVKVVSHEQQPA